MLALIILSMHYSLVNRTMLINCAQPFVFKTTKEEKKNRGKPPHFVS